MRYLKNCKTIEPEFIEMAENLFDKLIKGSIAPNEYSEILPCIHSGAKLNHFPVLQLKSVKARTSNAGAYFDYQKFFGNTDWISIDLIHIHLFQKGDVSAITLPTSVFGTHYEEVEVVYIAGTENIPDDVLRSIEKIAHLFRNGQIDGWNAFLPDDVMEVIDKYRKEG